MTVNGSAWLSLTLFLALCGYLSGSCYRTRISWCLVTHLTRTTINMRGPTRFKIWQLRYWTGESQVLFHHLHWHCGKYSKNCNSRYYSSGKSGSNLEYFETLLDTLRKFGAEAEVKYFICRWNDDENVGLEVNSCLQYNWRRNSLSFKILVQGCSSQHVGGGDPGTEESILTRICFCCKHFVIKFRKCQENNLNWVETGPMH